MQSPTVTLIFHPFKFPLCDSELEHVLGLSTSQKSNFVSSLDHLKQVSLNFFFWSPSLGYTSLNIDCPQGGKNGKRVTSAGWKQESHVAALALKSM